MGVPSTGRSVQIECLKIDRVVEGCLGEWWPIAHCLSLLQPLGATTALAPGLGRHSRDWREME